ncbi:nucleoside diphosphate kinase 2, chloroplastic-like [Prunus avium]|uniref:Nucleoside diphosphate kinase 2, chloroplastic-like n=1 Tax=Prunus avium TaxID=42229 RepID=A0A6P5RU69_PRUAV|nr:nucleoside diphosphate kinase 2, chloroplastic-like [Prunus avium]
METLAVFGGASPCVSSPFNAQQLREFAAYLTPTTRITVFSYFPSRPHAKTLPKPRNFLPHHLATSLEQVDETYKMVKPDGVQRGLVGEIISRFEKKGFDNPRDKSRVFMVGCGGGKSLG